MEDAGQNDTQKIKYWSLIEILYELQKLFYISKLT